MAGLVAASVASPDQPRAGALILPPEVGPGEATSSASRAFASFTSDVSTFREPAVDRREQVVRLGASALVAAEPAEADLALYYRKIRLRTIELLNQRP